MTLRPALPASNSVSGRTRETRVVTAKDLIGTLSKMSLMDLRMAAALVTQIERLNRGAEQLRRAQTVQAQTRCTSMQELKLLLNRADDSEAADRILSLLEASFQPAFVPPTQGGTIVRSRVNHGF